MSKYRHWIALAVAVYLLLVFVDRFVLVELLLRRMALPATLVLLEGLAIVGVGWALRRDGDPVVNFIVGYPIFGTLSFLVGTISTGATPVLLLVAVAGAVSIKRGGGFPFAADAVKPVAPLILILLCGFVMAQAPPVSLDELAYHLAIPHTWVLEGRALDLPLMSHSYFPLGVESADLPLLLLLGPESGGIASHLLHLLAAIATTFFIWRRTASALLTAAIVATPALALTAGWSLVDWPLLGICAVLYAAVEDDDERTVAAALGAGLLTKYTFIPFAIVVLALKRHWRGVPLGLAIGSIFFIRNLVLTGNPLAPFFGADAPHLSGYRAAYLSDYVFDGSFIDESLGVSLLIAAIVARGRSAWALLACGAALFFLAPSSRILVPFFAIPAMTALLQRRALAIVLAVAVGLQTLLIVFFTERSDAFSLIAARASEEEYVTKQRPAYSSIAWINSLLPERSRTLVVGLNETYWFTRPVRGGGNFDGERMSRYLALPTPEAVRERLRGDGITHVAVMAAPPPTAVERKVAERSGRLTPEAQRMLSRMLDRYAANVQSRADASLFTLKR